MKGQVGQSRGRRPPGSTEDVSEGPEVGRRSAEGTRQGQRIRLTEAEGDGASGGSRSEEMDRGQVMAD